MKSFVKKIFINLCLFAYKNGNRFLGGLGLQSIWPFGQMYRYIVKSLRNYDWPEPWFMNGHVVYITPGQIASFANYGDAICDKDFFTKEVRKGDTVLDIGANIGYISLTLAKIVGRDGAVFAFEPDPRNVELLEKNKKANSYENITVVPVAVGDRDGETSLYLSDFCSGWNIIYDMRTRVSELLKREREYTPREISRFGKWRRFSWRFPPLNKGGLDFFG